jgi:hypothetical protein
MANICFYKVKIKGKKNACYALYGSMACYSDKWIESESGTFDDYTMIIQGDCKWGVDCYCKLWDGEYPVPIPTDPQAAYQEGEDKYWYRFLEERSAMFEVEVWCNSLGEDDDFDFYEEEAYLDSLFEDPDEEFEEEKKEIVKIPGIFCYEHYINGIEVEDIANAPDEIKLDTDELGLC